MASRESKLPREAKACCVKGGSSWAESWERDGEKGPSVGVRKRELCVCVRE